VVADDHAGNEYSEEAAAAQIRSNPERQQTKSAHHNRVQPGRNQLDSVDHNYRQPAHANPTRAPMPICMTNSCSIPTPSFMSLTSTSSKPTVRKIAIGSFDALSISRTDFRRRLM